MSWIIKAKYGYIAGIDNIWCRIATTTNSAKRFDTQAAARAYLVYLQDCGFWDSVRKAEVIQL